MLADLYFTTDSSFFLSLFFFLSSSNCLASTFTRKTSTLGIWTRTLKLQDWTLTDDFAGVAIAGLDNGGLDTGHWRTGQWRTNVWAGNRTEIAKCHYLRRFSLIVFVWNISLLTINYELFTVFVPFADAAFPVVFAIMSRKTQALYTKVFDMIRNLVPQFAQTWAMADFEEASVSAFQEVFGNITVSCCWLHYAQALMKRVYKEGLHEGGLHTWPTSWQCRSLPHEFAVVAATWNSWCCFRHPSATWRG